jgi:NRPS condensation-like uncharacterized protein
LDSHASTFFDAAFFAGRRSIGDVQLHMVVDLAEPFSVEELTRAATATEATFPILGCRYVPGWWRDRWVVDPDLPSAVEAGRADDSLEDATTGLVRRAMDPCEVRPWRVVQLHSGDECRLVISVAHMLADANGALVVVRELARNLAGEDTTVPWQDRPMDRGMGQLLRSIRLRDLPTLLRQAAHESLLPLRYLRLARPAEPWPSNADRSGRELFRTISAAVGEGSPMRVRCRRLGCTVNDALVATLALLNRALFGRGDVGNVFTVNLRTLLADDRPRIANLSGLAMVHLPRDRVTDLDATVGEVSRRIGQMKRRFAGLPPLIVNFSMAWMLPHALARVFVGMWLRWAMAVLDRGLTVTNIGAMDPYLAPLGDRAVGASMIGPFLHTMGAPVITAAGFRDRLTLQVAGFDGRCERQLDQIADVLTELMQRWEESSD